MPGSRNNRSKSMNILNFTDITGLPPDEIVADFVATGGSREYACFPTSSPKLGLTKLSIAV